MKDVESEPVLVERARRGDSDAFSKLVRLHRSTVRFYIARYVKVRPDVEDIAQETFISAHQSLDSYRGEAPFGSWVLGIARRCLALRFRQESRRSNSDERHLGAAYARLQAERLESESTESEERSSALATLRECLKKLPREDANLVRAFYFDAKNAIDIGSRLGKKHSAVRMALLRIRRTLHRCMRVGLGE